MLSDDRSPYLRAHQATEARRDLKRLTSFGILIGWVLLLLGSFGWSALSAAPDPVWIALAVVGGALLVAGTFLPESLRLPERLWMGLAQIMGRVVMGALLTAVYLVWFWPLGTLQRLRRGCHPFYAWTDAAPTSAVGWEAITELGPRGEVAASARRNLVGQLLGTIIFFARRGHLALLPAIVVLLLIGLILFFVSSSALAPFVYTVF